MLYREVQITAKTKEEEFKGASITRYYVQSVQYLGDEPG